MKKIVIAFCLALLAVSVADARRKQPKAGDLEKGVYTDNEYNFSIKVPENWSDRIHREKDQARLTLLQKNYGIPTHYLNAEDYTYAPRIVIIAGESELDPNAFIDSLFSDSYDSDFKHEVYKEIDIVHDEDVSEVTPRGRRRFTLAGERASIWEGQAKYVKEIATSASGLGGERVSGAYGGSIIAVKKNGTMLVFLTMSEWDFFESVSKEAENIIQSLSWTEGESGSDS